MEFNFLKYDLNKIDHLGAEYDTCSVMHYGSTAFAKSWGKKTIVPKHKTKCSLGQRDGFSDTDIRNPVITNTNCKIEETTKYTKMPPPPTVVDSSEGLQE